MAVISREGSGVLNNASKAHLFGATFLVYNFCLLEECRERKGNKWGSGGREKTAMNTILFTLNNVTKLPVLTYYCGILLLQTFLLPFFHDNENEILFHLESFTSAMGFQP